MPQAMHQSKLSSDMCAHQANPLIPPLGSLKDQLKKQWEKNLKKHGVKFPAEGQRLNGIICLFENLNKPLSQDDMLDWFEKNDLPTYDRQIRHVADDGWYLVGGNKRATRFEIDLSLKSNQNMPN